MKDYNSIWIKWEALTNSNVVDLKKIIENFNFEVTNGFSIISKIATEEVLEQDASLSGTKEELERAMAFQVFAGYALFLIQNPTDPAKANLIASTKTSELGNKWIESFEKDKGAGHIGQIDPILASIMNMKKQIVLESLITKSPQLGSIKLKTYHLLESYLFWTIEQGFIIGMIENELNT